MESWKKVYKISLPNRESFYSNLVIDDVSKPNYQHAKCKRYLWNEEFGRLSLY